MLDGDTRRLAGSVVFAVSHGYEARADDDPFLALAEQSADDFTAGAIPGAFAVDTLAFRTHHCYSSVCCTPY